MSTESESLEPSVLPRTLRVNLESEPWERTLGVRGDMLLSSLFHSHITVASLSCCLKASPLKVSQRFGFKFHVPILQSQLLFFSLFFFLSLSLFLSRLERWSFEPIEHSCDRSWKDAWNQNTLFLWPYESLLKPVLTVYPSSSAVLTTCRTRLCQWLPTPRAHKNLN